MVGILSSRNPDKLQRVINASKIILHRYTDLTKEDKEDILLEVMMRFERDDDRYPVVVYVNYCRNKICDWYRFTRSKKRMLRKAVGNGTLYIKDLYLYQVMGEDMELKDVLPVEDKAISECDLYTSLEQSYPTLYKTLCKVMDGKVLTRKEKYDLHKERNNIALNTMLKKY